LRKTLSGILFHSQKHVVDLQQEERVMRKNKLGESFHDAKILNDTDRLNGYGQVCRKSYRNLPKIAENAENLYINFL